MDNKTVLLSGDRKYSACGFSKFDPSGEMAAITLENISDVEKSGIYKGENISFIVNGSYYEYYNAVVERIDRENGVIYVGNLENDAKELNKDIKVEVDMIFRIFYYEGEKIFSREVNVKDMSAGGFCFVCRDKLDMENKYEAILQVSEEPIIVDFKIVRRLCHEDEKEYVYGCSFVGLCMKEEEMIRKKVYQMISQKRSKM